MDHQHDDPKAPLRPFHFYLDMVRHDGTVISIRDYMQKALDAGWTLYIDSKGMPYRYEGGIFLDPDGLKVIPPPEVLRMAGLPAQNPTAARCDALGPHPQESGSRAANLADARQAGVSGPCVGTHDVRQAMNWNVRCLSDVVRDLPPHQQREWEHYMNNKRDEVHVGDAASGERWAKQRGHYHKLLGEINERRAAVMDKSSGSTGRGGLDGLAAPMPQSAVLHDLADRLSERIIALINSQPRSPTKDEIAKVVTEVIGNVGVTSDFLLIGRETLESVARMAADAEQRSLHTFPYFKVPGEKLQCEPTPEA